MHDDRELTIAGITRFMRERLDPAIHRDRRPLAVTAWAAPGEPVPFAEAIVQHYEPLAPGALWGRPWGTTWLHITGVVPAEWDPADRHEIVVDLGFTGAGPGFQAEGTVYDHHGEILAGISPRHRHVVVDSQPGDPVSVYVEAASNPDVITDGRFQPTTLGDWETADATPIYRLGRIDLAILDRAVWELRQDMWTLLGLAQQVPRDLPRHAEILMALGDAVSAVDPQAISETAADGRGVLSAVLQRPATSSEHRVHAVGHAHIDSAWLWPLREAARKVTRTFSNVVQLMDEHPELIFTASSAQHWEWVRDEHPHLFDRIRAYVEAERFVPTGGMWVESDTNMPGGEAMARQFIVGKRWFMEELGFEPEVVWLPDSFGYSAALPQIVRQAGARWFLTQKLSWNETNAMPHHTFWWEGIDGSRVFTHFPPVDTYNSELSAAELAHARRSYREKGRANTSLVPFGWGDGGGGPTREMIAVAKRSADLEGSPQVSITTAEAFFEAAHTEYPQPPVWFGELYLEKHRGTYTSQARTKRGNRRSEHLLREAELWATTATVRHGADYPYETLIEAWKQVLLNQFHDILPGSSIAWVYREAEKTYADLAARLETVIGHALETLTGAGEQELSANAGPLSVEGVTALSVSTPPPRQSRVTAQETTDRVILINDALEVAFDRRGLLVSLVDRSANRQLVPPDMPGNLLRLFRDTPAQWDAWDIDATYEADGIDLVAVDEMTYELEPDRASIRIVRSTAGSTIVETVHLGSEPTIDIDIDIDWHERQKLLKLEFPFRMHAAMATSEIQFGHIQRPTHANTSWDAARFETCAHRWVHIGEPGYGVAVANDSTYGYDIRRRHSPAGEVVTTIRPSLLRAPSFPDPDADQGSHRFRFAVRVGASIGDAIADGYRVNLPLRAVRGGRIVEPLFSIDDPAVVIEAVKLAEDRSGDVVIRLYESRGTRTTCELSPHFEYSAVMKTDLLERPDPDPTTLIETEPDGVRLAVGPFQIVTLRFVR